ncbi:secreted RxLR effector protein 161-like [Apium graveolens]|uniref:secreted RxLR effector protein 161-like n=1 Tax=Apium graveolens TaxID=4045 RepID=UPI003D79B6BF
MGVVSRFMEAPTTKHQQAVKHILRYIQGTVDHGLEYEKTGSKRVMIGFSDSDLAGDKQGVIALSSREAEYMAATTAACHSIWLRGLLDELIGQEVGVVTYPTKSSGQAMRKLLGVKDIGTGEPGMQKYV